MLVTLSFPPRPALEFVEDADLWELMHGLPALAERLLQKRCKLVRSAEGDHVYRRKLPGGILLQDLVMYQRQVFEDRGDGPLCLIRRCELRRATTPCGVPFRSIA